MDNLQDEINAYKRSGGSEKHDFHTNEGRWRVTAESFTTDRNLRWSDVRKITEYIPDFWLMNPYTLVLAYSVINSVDAKAKLNEVVNLLPRQYTNKSIPLNEIMQKSDIIRYIMLLEKVKLKMVSDANTNNLI